MLFVMSLTIVVKVGLMSNQDRSMSIGAVAAQAARCECPTLDECPLFEDPALLPQKVPGF
jgi:hypothetical protein